MLLLVMYTMINSLGNKIQYEIRINWADRNKNQISLTTFSVDSQC